MLALSAFLLLNTIIWTGVMPLHIKVLSPKGTNITPLFGS
jgi:hypothetical protein